MTKLQYWQAHVAKNPKLADEEGTVQVKVATLRKLMEEAYDRGAESSRKTSGALAEMLSRMK